MSKVGACKLKSDYLPCYGQRPRCRWFMLGAVCLAGTHWLWEIARMLVAGNAELPVLEKDDFMIEFNPSKEYFSSMPSPRILNTHVLYRHLPGLHNRKCKIIYVTRDPRDVAVSFYNHHRKLTSYYHYDGTWDDYFELFINGNGIPSNNLFNILQIMLSS